MNPGAWAGLPGGGAPAYPRAAFLNPEMCSRVRGTGNPVSTFTSDGIGASLVSLTGNQNDEVALPFLLAAGSYTFYSTHQVQAGGGIATYELDGHFLGELDHYAGSSARNNTGQFDFECAFDGLHELRIKSFKKNGLSAGYILNVQFWVIKERVVR